jgi:uncharacterized UPF0146 family protein
MRGATELAKFILASYRGKVVEVGAGHCSDVALLLQRLEVVATDREGGSLGPLPVEGDDIFAPCEKIYQGASLIYSLRPPLEMQLAIGRLALKIGCDVLVRPLGDEVADLPGFSRQLINQGQARFYLYRRL